MKSSARSALKYVKILENSGVPRQQAEAHMEATTMVITEHFATKDELKEQIGLVRTELKQEIASVRTELKQEIASVRIEIASVRSELKEEIWKVKEDLTIMMGKLFAWQAGLLLTVGGLIIAILHH